MPTPSSRRGLNLAYHGARAQNQSFNINMERSLDPAAGKIDVFLQEVRRALLNLISNGFYAATKRKGQENSEGYEPILKATTKSLALLRRIQKLLMLRHRSVDERLRHEIADQGAVVTSLKRRSLHHHYGHQLLFGVDPKSRAPYASPAILSG